MAQGFGQDVQRQSPRISQLKRKLDGSEDADLIMMSIMEVFRDIEYVPDPGNYYTFVYIPKTPDIQYDEHPLVAVTEVQRWGFRGFNYHWRMMRNYTWQEVTGALHHVRQNEIDYLRSLPYGKIRTK
jgi:hypothetical protein